MYKRTLLNELKEEPLLTTASQLNIKVDKGTKAHLILIHMNFLQDGVTKPVLLDALNQMATQITISKGSSELLKFDPTEYYEWFIRKFHIDGLAIANEGTGADNDAMDFVLPIILAPIDKDAIKFGKLPLLQKDFGMSDKESWSILIEYPADANELDVRKITVYAIAIPGDTPSKICMYRSTTTEALSVGEDQKLSLSQLASHMLYEWVLKQTSYLSEGDNTDVRTIETISYAEGQEKSGLDTVRLEHASNPVYLADNEDDGVIVHDDQYQIVEFHHSDDYSTSQKLTVNSVLLCEVGVAEAVTYVQRLISPN